MTKTPKQTAYEESHVKFGSHFSDHMLICTWDKENEWGRPKIVPFGDILLSPAALLNGIQVGACMHKVNVYNVCTL